MKTQAYCRTWSSLHHASLPLKFWDFAFCTAVYLINRLPTTSLNFLVTYHMLFQQFPDYTFLKTFGCACFPLRRPYNNHKVDFRSAECLFLGYSTSHKGYKCMSSSGRIYISKDVIFNESKFPYADLFETFTSLGQSTSSSIPFQFHSIPIIQSPNLSHPTSNSPQTHTSLFPVISILLMLDSLHLFLHSPLLIISQFSLTLTYLFQLLVQHLVQFSPLVLNPQISIKNDKVQHNLLSQSHTLLLR